MNQEKVQNLRDFIKKESGGANFLDEENIFENGLVSSLFVLKLLTFIESEFDVEIETDDLTLDNFSSINSIIDLLANNL